MAAPGWIELFVERLEGLGLPYMVTGSVASMIYGEPRLTLDVDIVLDLDSGRCAALLAAFPESEFYRPSRGHFNPIHYGTGMKADIYLTARDALHRWGLANRRRIRSGEGELAVAPLEYVIVRKLEFWSEGGSEKHIRDIRAMLASELPLDREFLTAELRRRGFESAWSRVTEAE